MNVKTLIQCKPIESTVNNINLPKGNTETKIVLPYPRMRQYMCLITQKSHPNTILVRKQNFLNHLFFFFFSPGSLKDINSSFICPNGIWWECAGNLEKEEDHLGWQLTWEGAAHDQCLSGQKHLSHTQSKISPDHQWKTSYSSFSFVSWLLYTSIKTHQFRIPSNASLLLTVVTNKYSQAETVFLKSQLTLPI